MTEADERRVSKWTLRTTAFGQAVEFSWQARDLTPVVNHKIHWVSVGGLPNRGAVTFYARDGGQDGCRVQLSIAYEVPPALQPLGDAVRPLVEDVLVADLRRFVAVAQARARAAAGAAAGGGGGGAA